MMEIERRKNGVRRVSAHARHGTLFRGSAGGHEAAVAGQWRAGVFLEKQRIPAERFRQIVSYICCFFILS